MKYEKEIVLNFPLKKKNKKRKKRDSEMDEKLKKFFELTEERRKNEWQQEYFVIYNSYLLDNQ